MIARIADPQPGRFLTARWLDLLMLNYAVDPALLAPLVPAGTTLDLWDGAAIASLVGFRFVDTRVLGVPIPGHRDFDEVNLRFYVQRREGNELRRGVVFVRELVPRAAIAWVARTLYNEPYRALPMRHRHSVSGSSRSLSYEWRESNDWIGISASTDGPAAALVRGSEAEFITEHYWGYTRQRDGGTIEYRVAHPAWSVWSATEPRVLGSLERTYGPQFSAALEGAPRSAFVAVGSEITVHRGRRLPR